MKCNNKYYQIVEGVGKSFTANLWISTSAIVNNEEQAPKALASADGLVVREIVGDETGIGKVITDWEFEDGVIHISRDDYSANEAKFTIRGCIGNARFDATMVVVLNGNYYDVDFPDYVVKYISDGEGGDFKTNEYYDADSRLLMVREDDGSTTIYDEHENPIIKRLASGATQIFDAFQSVRFQIGPHGGMLVNIPDGNDITFGSHSAVIIGSGTVGKGSLVNGEDCEASGDGAHAEGSNTNASSYYSHAEGGYSTASGIASHAEGKGTTASGECSHAEGSGTTASYDYTHAEGVDTNSSGEGSHSEGLNTVVNSEYAHAEGANTYAEGYASHAEGDGTNAGNDSSHAEGLNTATNGDHQHVQGTYNFPDECEDVDGAFMHGCGTEEERKNAFIIKGSEVYVFGVGGYDGTNSNDPNVKSLRQVLQAIQVKLVNVPS